MENDNYFDLALKTVVSQLWTWNEVKPAEVQVLDVNKNVTPLGISWRFQQA